MAQTEPLFYNTNFPVGDGPAANREKTDIMLVQLILREYGKENPNTEAGEPLKEIDGNFTIALTGWISSFQFKHGMMQDGRVDPVPGGSRATNRNGSIYTLVAMNMWFKKRFPDRFYKLKDDTEIPGPLRAALWVAW